MNFRRTTWGLGILGTLAVAACGGDDTTPTPGGDTDASMTDASMTNEGGGNEASTTPEGGANSEASTSEGGGAEGGLTGAALIARGDYIVNHVAACGDCHTPRNTMGALDETKHLAGSPMAFADLVPDAADGGAGVGKIYVRNLTPDMATGLGSWTDAEIKSAFLDGNAKGVDGGTRPLFPIMPYFVFHNMTAQDASAIVAYLRSIPAVANAIPAREPLPFPLPAAAPPVPATSIPNSTLTAEAGDAYASAQRGKYLAGNIGICMECHTEHNMGVPVLKENALFGGNNSFATADIGLPPAYGATITQRTSRRTTPQASRAGSQPT